MKKRVLIAILVLAPVFISAHTNGYEKTVEVTAGVGLDKAEKFTFGISMVNGYRINNCLYVGAGVGYEYLEGLFYQSFRSGVSRSVNDIRNNIKVYARIKANFVNKVISPFLSLDLGGNFGLSSNQVKMASGFFIEPSFGIDFCLKDGMGLYLMLGYNEQQYQYENFFTGSNKGIQNRIAGKFAIHLGFVF